MTTCAWAARWWPLVIPVFAGCATTARDTSDLAPLEAGRAGTLDLARDSARDSARETARDDRALTGASLSRSAFVRAVLDRNPSIESARQAWRAALARARGSGVLDDPMVTADVAPLSIASSRARFGWDATVSQRLPWPGKLGLDQAAAAAEADAVRSDFESTKRELALAASLLFDRYFTTYRSIEVNAHHVEIMRDMQAAATAQYESGHASAQDPLQAEFELTHMEHDALIFAAQRDVVVAQMNDLLHRAPERPLPPPPRELPVAPVADTTSVGRLESEAVDRRPDIAAARAHARAEELRGRRARREYFPDVTLSTGYSTMWDAPEQRWSVGLSFNLPVQTGRRASAVDEASAMRAQYEADAARLSDAARTQVFVALKQLEESAHEVHIYAERLVPIARDEVDAARAAFVASRVPFVALVDAEKNLRSVELEEQMIRADYDRRRAELDRALGRTPGLDDAEVAQ